MNISSVVRGGLGLLLILGIAFLFSNNKKRISWRLVGMVKNGVLSPKGITMATYALCGFANFSSIAIQIGGISPMAPHRKKDIASLGLRAVLGGTLATLMTATLAGILLG